MIDAPTSAIIVAASAVVVLVFLNALRKIVARGEWSGTAILGTLLVMLTLSVVDVVITYLDEGTKVIDPHHNVHWAQPEWGNQLEEALYVVLVVIAAAIFVVRAVRQDAVLNLPAVLFVVLALVSAGSAVLHGDNPLRPYSVVLLSVLVACTVAPRGLGIHVGIGAFCMIAAIAAGLAIVLHSDFATLPCTTDKCGILNFQFRGFMDSGNALALYLVLAMPFIYIGFGSWEGAILCTYVFGLVLLTGSRSGTTAGVITFVVLILVRPNIRRPTPAPIRNALLYLGLAAAVVVGILLPFSVDDPTVYTGRGNAWMLARDALSDPATLFHGTGLLGWQHVQEAGLIDFSAVYSVHNQWLQVLFSTGLIGFLLFVTALAVLVWQAGRTYSLVVGCVLLPVSVLSLTERPWPIDTVEWLAWALPGALLSYPVARRAPADRRAKRLRQPVEREPDRLVVEQLERVELNRRATGQKSETDAR